MPERAPSALDDVRVLDLAGEIGQYCTKLLADLGADVIKIEPPSGDPVRDLPPFYHDEADRQKSLYWLNLNTSKRSVTLDLEQPEGRRLFERLVATADIVVESFEPGYLDGLGLGYEGLARIRPDVILTSVTGFGQTGPHAHYKAPDIVGVAMAGIMWLAGDPQDPPNVPPWRQGFISASIIAAAGTLMALYHRDIHGEGQHVDVSMQEALSIAQETAMQSWDMLQSLRNRAGERGMIPVNFPGIGAYECKDGYVFGYVGTPGGAPWSELLDWLIEEGAAEDLTEEPYLGVLPRPRRPHAGRDVPGQVQAGPGAPDAEPRGRRREAVHRRAGKVGGIRRRPAPPAADRHRQHAGGHREEPAAPAPAVAHAGGAPGARRDAAVPRAALPAGRDAVGRAEAAAAAGRAQRRGLRRAGR